MKVLASQMHFGSRLQLAGIAPVTHESVGKWYCQQVLDGKFTVSTGSRLHKSTMVLLHEVVVETYMRMLGGLQVIARTRRPAVGPKGRGTS